MLIYWWTVDWNAALADFFFSCLKAYSPAVTFLIQHFKPGEKRDLKITEHKEKDNSKTDR